MTGTNTPEERLTVDDAVKLRDHWWSGGRISEWQIGQLLNIACRAQAHHSETVPTEKPRRWADQYDFDKSDPATRLFVAASNWMDRAERAEQELARVKVERGELALKLAGAECFIEEQRKKGNIK